MVELVVVLILVGLRWYWWLWLSIIVDGGLVMEVLVTAAARVAVKISNNLFHCLLWGGIYGIGSVRGGSYIGWVVMVVVMMARSWWSSYLDCGDDGCCNISIIIRSR